MIAGAELLPVLTPEKRTSTNPANEVARKLTGRAYLSWSSVNLFRQCPLHYRFKYIDGLPEESVSSALVFATGIHTAVESHFQALLAGEEQPGIERLMFAYRASWLGNDADAIQFGSKETRETLENLATRMLTAFVPADPRFAEALGHQRARLRPLERECHLLFRDMRLPHPNNPPFLAMPRRKTPASRMDQETGRMSAWSWASLAPGRAGRREVVGSLRQ